MSESLRVAILEFYADQKSGTGVRGRAIKDYLVGLGHSVDVVAPDPDRLNRFYYKQQGVVPRVVRKLTRGKALPHLWDFLADELEPPLRQGRYDVVIGRGQDVANVLTRTLDCVKILDMANVLFLESYYTWGPNLDEVEETFRRELRVCDAVDFILSPHDLFTEYFLKQFDATAALAPKMVTARLGGYPSDKRAAYAPAPRLVYAGAYYYIQDPFLLATLTRLSPYAIECYGPNDPNRAFLPARLNYKGYGATTDFLADYQFGVITVSRDLLRQYSPSTKFAYYFAHGLPVLFPTWMKEGYEYGDCAIPYDEDTFVERVREASERTVWQAMSDAAYDRARALSWDAALAPLGALVERKGAGR